MFTEQEIFDGLKTFEFLKRNPGFLRFKGLKSRGTYLDAGFVYAPYVPLQFIHIEFEITKNEKESK